MRRILDPAANFIRYTDSVMGAWSFQYDTLNRLAVAAHAAPTPLLPANPSTHYCYSLDPVGNRTAATSTLPGLNPIAGTYNADDKLSAESYDDDGNVTVDSGGNTYTYDSQNHMLTKSGNGTTVSMVYDAFGNRVAKTVTNLATHTGVTTQYLVEDDVNPTGLPQVVEELVGPFGAGVVTRQYTYGLQRISQNLSPEVTGNSAWTPSFYVYDGGGSVRQLTNSAGAVTDSYEYDAFGNSFTTQGTTPNNYLYRGEQYDSDLGLYYLRARYYNPATGRFMSRDPENGKFTDPKSLHKYLYAGGDPVNRLDPMGREGLIEFSIQIAVKYGAYVALAAVGVSIVCEFIEDAEAIKEAAEISAGATVRPSPSGAGCGGPHPAPGGPGHPDEPPTVPPGWNPTSPY